MVPAAAFQTSCQPDVLTAQSQRGRGDGKVKRELSFSKPLTILIFVSHQRGACAGAFSETAHILAHPRPVTCH